MKKEEAKRFFDNVLRPQKTDDAISTVLQLFEQGKITRTQAYMLLQGMNKTIIFVNGDGIHQDGYNCALEGNAGHHEI